MRRLASASLLWLTLLASCSAVDDFTKFKFVDDAAVPRDLGPTDAGADLATTDMAGGPVLPGFGQPCTTVCSGILVCFKDFGGRPAPSGICTRMCLPNGPPSCGDLPDADCITIEGVAACMPRCNPSKALDCRIGYSCCDGNTQTTGGGDCAPPKTDFCGQ